MSIPDILPIVNVFILASNAVLFWFQWKSGAQVQKADAAEKLGNAYTDLIVAQEKRIEAQEKRIEKLENSVEYLKKEHAKVSNHNAILMKQLLEHGVPPAPPPKTGELKG
jgi:cell division protein FtsB